MKWIIGVLALLLVITQAQLWFDDGGIAEVWRVKQAVKQQTQENATLRERNSTLEAEVQDLRKGFVALEERARNDMGMVRPDEQFYQVVD